MTWASGPSLKPPVLAAFLVDEIERATPTASDEPSVSTHSRSGMWRSSPSLMGSDHITPDESITRSEERSHRPGSASSWSSSGLAKASPTIEISVTRCRAMVSRMPAASNFTFSVSTTDPPPSSALNAENAAVPCISGAAGRTRVRAETSASVSWAATSARPPSSG